MCDQDPSCCGPEGRWDLARGARGEAEDRRRRDGRAAVGGARGSVHREAQVVQRRLRVRRRAGRGQRTRRARVKRGGGAWLGRATRVPRRSGHGAHVGEDGKPWKREGMGPFELNSGSTLKVKSYLRVELREQLAPVRAVCPQPVHLGLLHGLLDADDVSARHAAPHPPAQLRLPLLRAPRRRRRRGPRDVPRRAKFDVRREASSRRCDASNRAAAAAAAPVSASFDPAAAARARAERCGPPHGAPADRAPPAAAARPRRSVAGPAGGVGGGARGPNLRELRLEVRHLRPRSPSRSPLFPAAAGRPPSDPSRSPEPRGARARPAAAPSSRPRRPRLANPGSTAGAAPPAAGSREARRR